MKKLKFLLSILILAGGFFTTVWADTPNPELLNLWVPNVDCPFEIVLPANPSTGYRWQLTHYEKDFLKPLKSNYEAPNTALIGAGGKMKFTFLAQKGKTPHKTSLVFTYLRPWEKNSATKQIVEVYFECPKDLKSGTTLIKAN